MMCPFCHARNPANRRACQTCGGPLQNAVNAPTFAAKPRDFEPIAPRLPAPRVPEIVARREREAGAARIMASEFCGAQTGVWALFLREDGELWAWNPARDWFGRVALGRWTKKVGPPSCVLFTLQSANSPDGMGLVLGFPSGEIRVFAIEFPPDETTPRAREWLRFEAHHGRVWSLAATPFHLWSGGSDGAIVQTLWPETARALWAPRPQSKVLLDGLGALQTLAVSGDGALLALGTEDGTVQLWRLAPDSDQIRLDWTRSSGRAPIRALQFSANNNLLLSHDREGNFHQWAAQTGHELPISTQKSALTPSFAPDSRSLALGDFQTTTIFDAWTGALCHTLTPLKGEPKWLRFGIFADETTGDASLLVATQREIAVWDVPIKLAMESENGAAI